MNDVELVEKAVFDGIISEEDGINMLKYLMVVNNDKLTELTIKKERLEKKLRSE